MVGCCCFLFDSMVTSEPWPALFVQDLCVSAHGFGDAFVGDDAACLRLESAA